MYLLGVEKPREGRLDHRGPGKDPAFPRILVVANARKTKIIGWVPEKVAARHWQGYLGKAQREQCPRRKPSNPCRSTEGQGLDRSEKGAQRAHMSP